MRRAARDPALPRRGSRPDIIRRGPRVGGPVPVLRDTGGFFADAPLPDAPPVRSVGETWFADGAARLFRNARSALALGVPAAFGRIGTLWRPAYLCRAVEDAADHARRAGTVTDHRPYPLLPDGPLEPDAAFLGAALRPGDAVLVVSYFGRPPGEALRRLARDRRDVTWIEDRAGALLPGPAWGDAILYSPRKLLPVAEGGLLILRGRAGDAGTPGDAAPSRPMPATFAEHRAREAAMTVAPDPMDRESLARLFRLDLAGEAARRRANAAALLALLPARNTAPLHEGNMDWPPLGFPVLVPDAAAASAAMAARGVFCPVAWPDLAATGPCRRARALANRILLLPCDGRYGPPDMERVADAFRKAAP